MESSIKQVKEAFLEMLKEDEIFRERIVEELEDELICRISVKFEKKNGE